MTKHINKRSMSITVAVLGITIIGSIYGSASASNPSMNDNPNNINISGRGVNSHVNVHRPYAESANKEVYEKLKKSWDKSIEKINETKSKSINPNQWESIAEPDLDIKYLNNLTSEEASAFTKAHQDALDAYQLGDLLDVVLLNKDRTAAIIVWERANGNTHVANLEQKVETDGKNVWNLVSQEDIE